MINVKLGSKIKLELSGFIPSLEADLYWILEFTKSSEQKDLNSFIEENLSAFQNYVIEMEPGKRAYYPYDISDQHIGFIVIKKINKKILNCYIGQNIHMMAGDISPIFDPGLKLDDNKLIILDGKIVKTDDFTFEIEKHEYPDPSLQ